jgi:hypothetical protein
MFFSKVLLLAISFAAISVLATPHALHHHALHRRAVAARVASTSNSSDVSFKRRNSRRCLTQPSSSASIPGVTAIVKKPQSSSSIVTSSSAPPPPPPTSTSQQPPPTTSTTNPPSGGGGGGGGGDTFTDGDGTFFDTGLGACGITNVDTDFIVAVSMIRFDAVSTGNSNTNPLCGKKVSITFNGVTKIATVVDRCVGCAKDSLDMTPTLFQNFAPLGVGRIHGIVWSFI